VISAKGAIAWTQGKSPSAVLYALDSKGYRTLDQDAIAVSSLKVNGSKLTWTNAGARKSSTLAAY
jgi:hypothetical protein